MGSITGFDRFYKVWMEHLRCLVFQLKSAPRQPSTQDDVVYITRLIHWLMNHYAEYYREKSMAASRDVVSVLMAPWASSLERSLHWIAGWRPTTLFHLVYTESSVLFESRVVDILRGLRTGDLGDLSPSQFRKVSELQCQTVKEENAITDELAGWQDGASEIMGPCTNFEAMMGLLEGVVRKADDLRMRTIKKLVELLTPQQAVGFLIAASELHFGIQHLGSEEDHQREIDC